MYVTKRDGNREIVSFDKILKRIKKLGEEAGIKLNYTTLVMKVIDQLYDGISTTKLDELSAEQCASMSSIHPDYNVLAGRIAISNHHKNTSGSFVEVMTQLYQFKDKQGKHSPIISSELYDTLIANSAKLEAMCQYDRDYLIDYFGYKTLERAYLAKIDRRTVERPQHMWLRVAMGIHGQNLDRVQETYEHMSQKYFTHATPTLFNSGTPRPQNSSCFLIAMEDDSVDGIYNTLKDCALISKWAGGIGLHIHNIRASGSHIRGTNGSSNGIVPMLKVFNNTAKYIDQCLHPETIIYTTDGPIPIRECVPGQTQVINSTGDVETIGQVLEHAYSGPLFEIKLAAGPKPLRISPEHPVYAILNHETLTAELLAGVAKPEWTDAKDLQVGDCVVFPVPIYENDAVALTPELCSMYGLILSGIMNANATDVQSKTSASIRIMHTDESLIDDLAIYLMGRQVEMARHGDRLEFIMTPNIPFCKSDFFQNDQVGVGKRWLHLPRAKTEAILKGMHLNRLAPGPLMDHIHYLWLRAGKIGQSYGDSLLMPIQEIHQMTEYDGLLYDLQMTKHHNYVIENGLVHNGGGRRNGSFAIYLEPWHADIEAFLQMRKNHGDEELKARDLFYALWVPDLFMERVKADGTWTLMCPDECPGLADAVGDAFVELYTKYETAGLGHKTMKARDLWFQVLDAQMETGTPYLCFKDAANKKSNQQNLGTIKSSNLCVAPETIVLTDHGHVEIQTLAGQQVNVWNGHEFSEVTVVQTGTDEELMEVETDDGCKLTCTPYHKFFVGPERTVVEAQNLRRGDVLTTCELPTLGQSVAIKMEWFTEFCAACAYTMEDSHTELILGSNPTDLLLAKYILQTCGVHVAIHENGYILLTASVIQHLIRLGIEVPWPMDSPIQDLDQGPSVSQLGPVRIKRTRKLDRRDATYCFTELKRSAAVFNGIYTSQCSEIIQYSSPTETAVCNLASIALPAFVRKDTEGKASIDYEKLHAVTKIVTYNLNRVIDVNYYPTPKTQLSNMRHRPIGIGVQGLADVFMMMDLAFTSEEAQTLNKHIFETIYHGALEQSCDLAEVEGAYETFAGSPASKGLLQFDLWNSNSDSNNNLNERYDWTALKARIQAVGLRNSLLLAPMPTASTSQILGYNECIEPITSNIYNRRTLAGEFILANKYLMHDLIQLDLWNDKMKNAIIANNGSVQSIETIPQHIRDKYKTVWEIPMRKLIDMAADRGVYICQSQSLNLWLEDPTYNSLTSMHFYSWSKGLKTGIYYLRRRARHHAQQFTIEPTKTAASSSGEEEICEMCSA